MSNKDFENLLGFVQFLVILPVLLAGVVLVAAAIWEGVQNVRDWWR